MQVTPTNHKISTNYSDYVLLNLKKCLSHSPNSKIYVYGETALNLLMGEPIKSYYITTCGVPEEVLIPALYCTPFGFTRTDNIHMYLGAEYPFSPQVVYHTDESLSDMFGMIGTGQYALQEAIAIDIMTGKIYKPAILNLKIKNGEYELPKLLLLNNMSGDLHAREALRFLRLSIEHDFGMPLMVKGKLLDSIRNMHKNHTPEEWQHQLNLIFFSEKCHQIIRWLGYEGVLDSLCDTKNMWKQAKKTPQHKATSADVFAHTIRTIKYCHPDVQLNMAALFHDSGKVSTWKRKNFIGHEQIGAEIARNVLKIWGYPVHFYNPVYKAIQNHMLIGGIQRNLKVNDTMATYKKAANMVIGKCGGTNKAVLSLNLAIADKLSTHNKIEYVMPLMNLRRIVMDAGNDTKA